ncbi:helix-turn-helix domain-containing protein [Rugosimonospora africana]|uniref:Transcriptional regulator n=1 Tax=Rugosimonospora africana TaxID=556532 RepID=A0A8J3VUD9_9ACTN|nr:helix-turn-helix domain-containing protein [Rugosimonospora africana]GIH18626.1 transcriptional regulator [Rugosimonospora africana]
MPLTVDLSVSELANTRFAISPLSETVSGLQLLGARWLAQRRGQRRDQWRGQWRGRPGSQDSNLRWIRWATDELAARPLTLPYTWPLIVGDRPSWPQFLVPAPLGARTTIDDDLAAMCRTTARQVRASLRRVFGADLPDAVPPAEPDAVPEAAPPAEPDAEPEAAPRAVSPPAPDAAPDALPDAVAELAARPAAGLQAIAAELREAYDRLIAPHWPRIRAVLDADIAYRARRLAAGGVERLFADLHPDLRWHDGRLTLHNWRSGQVSRATAPGGLVLLPVVLGTSYPQVKLHTSTQTTVRYPARGAGTLWSTTLRSAALQSAGTQSMPEAGGCSPSPQPCSGYAPPGSAIRLLGRHRAELLAALRSPATTTDLARALRVSPSAVSQHLRVLRDSGLVATERSGRSVLYLTTERGLDLLEPAPGPPPTGPPPRDLPWMDGQRQR